MPGAISVNRYLELFKADPRPEVVSEVEEMIEVWPDGDAIGDFRELFDKYKYVTWKEFAPFALKALFGGGEVEGGYTRPYDEWSKELASLVVSQLMSVLNQGKLREDGREGYKDYLEALDCLS